MRLLRIIGRRTGNEQLRRITAVSNAFVTLAKVSTEETRLLRLRGNLYRNAQGLVPPLIALREALGDLQLTADTEHFLRWHMNNNFETHGMLALLIQDVRKNERELAGKQVPA